MTQIAKLYLRGSLVNVTAKNLTEEQKHEVETLMYEAWNDPRLDNAKHEFCQALGRTIGGEYLDKEFAMQEVWVTLWRTSVDILYHNKKENIATDKNARKKYFQTCIFQYLKQILNENKIPTTLEKTTIAGCTDYVITHIIKSIFENSPKRIEYYFNNLDQQFIVNTNLLPLEIIEKIWELKEEYPEIEISENGISLNKLTSDHISKEIKVRTKVGIASYQMYDSDEDKNQFQQHCEYQMSKEEHQMKDIISTDLVDTLKQRLTNKASEILDFMIDPPQEFLETYYPKRKTHVKPKYEHVAKWLGLTTEDISNSMKMIQDQARAIDLVE